MVWKQGVWAHLQGARRGVHVGQHPRRRDWSGRGRRSPAVRVVPAPPASGRPSFSWALPPLSCLLVPLEVPFDRRVWVTARAPKRCQPQSMDLLSNDQKVGSAAVPVEWTEIPFVVPTRFLAPGENLLCLHFENAEFGETDSVDSVAAAVATIRLP
jgi:hypothetical protein